MRNPVPSRSKALLFLVALTLCSCQIPPRAAEVPKPPAKASPALERYKKEVEDRLGPIWYRLVDVHENDLHLGTVKTTFEIPAKGGPGAKT
jgi:hypothetical protein